MWGGRRCTTSTALGTGTACRCHRGHRPSYSRHQNIASQNAGSAVSTGCRCWCCGWAQPRLARRRARRRPPAQQPKWPIVWAGTSLARLSPKIPEHIWMPTCSAITRISREHPANGTSRRARAGEDGRYWHEADIEVLPTNVRFWGNSGHRPKWAPCRLLTHSGHR